MMASPKDEFHRLSASFNSARWTSWPPWRSTPRRILMQGLIYPGEITVFRHQPGAAWREFMYLLARSLASDVDLGPFQTQGVVDTLLLVSNGLLPADAAYAAALQSYDADWTATDTRQHLHLYHRAQQQDESVQLDSAEGRNALLASLQPGTKAVIVDDMLSWFSDRQSPPHDKVRVELVLQDLDKRGIALVLFAASGKAGDRFCQQHLAHRMHEVCLTPDTCAPARNWRRLAPVANASRPARALAALHPVVVAGERRRIPHRLANPGAGRRAYRQAGSVGRAPVADPPVRRRGLAAARNRQVPGHSSVHGGAYAGAWRATLSTVDAGGGV